MSGIELFAPDDAEQLLAERLASGAWWLFVGAGEVLEMLEARFYDGAANADFQVLFGPPVGEFARIFPRNRLLVLTFAHKRRLPAQTLREVLREEGALGDLDDLGERDVIMLGYR